MRRVWEPVRVGRKMAPSAGRRRRGERKEEDFLEGGKGQRIATVLICLLVCRSVRARYNSNLLAAVWTPLCILFVQPLKHSSAEVWEKPVRTVRSGARLLHREAEKWNPRDEDREDRPRNSPRRKRKKKKKNRKKIYIRIRGWET